MLTVRTYIKVYVTTMIQWVTVYADRLGWRMKKS